ncbi:hypothetical protein FRC01_008975 [Tulasnella sp. 417]|nr:hypothetical protein FRC01_008975 [Tulasnella sp. 417]
MAAQNQAVNLPLDHPFPQTHAFIQLIGAQGVQNAALGQLLQALHQLNATITMNQAAEVDEAILVTQFTAVLTEAMAWGPLIAANDALLAAYNAFQMELVGFLGEVHLINNPPPPQNNLNAMFAMAAGGALLTIGAVAIGPAIALGALNVVGFSSAGPVAGSLAAAIQSAVYGGAVTSGSLFALCQSAAMGGITVGAAQVAAGITALGAGAGLVGAVQANENNPNPNNP